MTAFWRWVIDPRKTDRRVKVVFAVKQPQTLEQPLQTKLEHFLFPAKIKPEPSRSVREECLRHITYH